MKLATGLALALAVSPAAHAEPACEDIRSLVDLALEDFEPIKGKQTAYDPRSYIATVDLPRADECVVRDLPIATYECSWTFASFETLTAAQESLLAATGACLSDWELVPEKKNTQALGDNEFTIFGATLRGNGRHDPVSVRSWGIEAVRQGAAIRALRFSVSSKERPPKVA